MTTIGSTSEAIADVSDNPIRDRSPNYFVALLLLLGPLCCYLPLIGRWSLSGAEYYTLRDSSASSWEILTTISRPIYYLICHYMIQLPFPLEITSRLPAAIATALIAPTFYLLLWRPEAKRPALYAAILIAANPWLFELSQISRFYSLMFWFASMATLSLYRWLTVRRHQWLVLFLLSATLATFTHNSALVIIPAGILAACIVLAVQDWQGFLAGLRARGPIFVVCAAIIAILAGVTNYNTFIAYFDKRDGGFGDYSRFELLVATIIRSGIPVWALAFIPMLKPLRRWTRDELFLFVVVTAAALPYFVLVPYGGGIAPRYLLATLPPLFVLAAIHWAQIVDHLSSMSLKIALGAGLLACHVPSLVSTLSDGNHHDYRGAVQFVESLGLDDLIIASTSHGMYNHYATGDQIAVELGELSKMNGGKLNDNSFSWRAISKVMDDADASGKPLILVSRQDRELLDVETSRWLGDRFTVLASIERPRYDHRRNRLVVYQYRFNPHRQVEDSPSVRSSP